jgi:hypothetical protein
VAETQPSLFDMAPETMARRTDPYTSHDAARMARQTARTVRAAVLEALRAHPDGLTDYELAELVGRQQNSAGKRRGELVQMGLVISTGHTRPAPSGARALVWVAV